MSETRSPSRRPTRGDASIRWKLLALWAVVIIAYGLAGVLTNPEIMIPIERQHEIYYGTVEIWCSRPGMWSMEAIKEGADKYHLHQRAVWLILDEGDDQNWDAPCVPE